MNEKELREFILREFPDEKMLQKDLIESNEIINDSTYQDLIDNNLSKFFLENAKDSTYAKIDTLISALLDQTEDYSDEDYIQTLTELFKLALKELYQLNDDHRILISIDTVDKYLPCR